MPRPGRRHRGAPNQDDGEIVGVGQIGHTAFALTGSVLPPHQLLAALTMASRFRLARREARNALSPSSPLAYDHLRVLNTALEPLHTSPGVADLRDRITA
ncbi:MAG: hypothetical protein ACT4NY_29690 [Pseudonocardiales bacterium]